mmetsp:Transcript_34389/g.85748  ORF Transcript_34389/g.85748 Transcript_34389/m.85748 type:complete len:87 (-) Transcript_34389:22-282(-)
MTPEFLAWFHKPFADLLEGSDGGWAGVNALASSATNSTLKATYDRASRFIDPVSCVPLSAIFSHLNVSWIDFAILDARLVYSLVFV